MSRTLKGCILHLKEREEEVSPEKSKKAFLVLIEQNK